ncbi:MAG: oxidoreductase [Streptococcaceae bacterium]|jgi:NAD(P)-dependent dehydrogenase (short-subunit alcohol dehydrogenase family)|nr:oxidoreductase [Streptococcaceae bacterium]
MSKKVALITGASSGIGKEAAISLHQAGFIVYGAARRVENMTDLSQMGVHILPLDVTNEESMISCVQSIFEKEGRIDVLVNNAGYGSYGAVEDVPMSEARRQMEVNVFGLARMTQLVLPKMRENGYGKIVNISSMGGRVWTSFGAWYHASKFAIEGFSHSLRLEVVPFGIDVILIEPGGIKTPWGTIAADNLEEVSKDGAYEQQAKKTAENMRRLYVQTRLTKPEKIAKVISKSVSVAKPKTRYLLGYGAKASVFALNVFGDRVYDKIIQKFM